MEYDERVRAVCSATHTDLDCTGDLVAGGSKRHSLQVVELSQMELSQMELSQIG